MLGPKRPLVGRQYEDAQKTVGSCMSGYCVGELPSPIERDSEQHARDGSREPLAMHHSKKNRTDAEGEPGEFALRQLFEIARDELTG